MMFRKWRRVNWLERNVPRHELAAFKTELEMHRTAQFATRGKQPRGLGRYIITRTLESLRLSQRFDLAKKIREMLPERGKLTVFDSGTGGLDISAGLKRLFGRRLFATALNLTDVKAPRGLIRDLKREIKRGRGGPFSYDGRGSLQRKEKHLASLLQAEKNKRIVDEFVACPIEDFETTRRYHVVLDFSGPLHHSRFKQRILERYFSMLEPNGRVFVSGGSEMKPIFKILPKEFGPESERAKQTGFFFQVREVQPNTRGLKPGKPTGVYELVKLPVK